eukprot:SAG11_NODE_880_length_6754_cov_29.319760_4_plen_330_part_00
MGGRLTDDDRRSWLNAAKTDNIGLLEKHLEAHPELLNYRGQSLSNSALHWAAAKGHVDALQLLLDRRANIDALNSSGASALHSSAANGAVACVELLLAHGADPDLFDHVGRTARDCAQVRSHAVVVKVIDKFTSGQETDRTRQHSPKVWHKQRGFSSSSSLSSASSPIISRITSEFSSSATPRRGDARSERASDALDEIRSLAVHTDDSTTSPPRDYERRWSTARSGSGAAASPSSVDSSSELQVNAEVQISELKMQLTEKDNEISDLKSRITSVVQAHRAVEEEAVSAQMQSKVSMPPNSRLHSSCPPVPLFPSTCCRLVRAAVVNPG